MVVIHHSRGLDRHFQRGFAHRSPPRGSAPARVVPRTRFLGRYASPSVVDRSQSQFLRRRAIASCLDLVDESNQTWSNARTLEVMANSWPKHGQQKHSGSNCRPLTCGFWSGRRDSNPRPSPWQKKCYLAQLCHQPLHTFINVLLGFLLTAVGRNEPLLASACAFFVERAPRIFAPHAPHKSAERCVNPYLGEVMPEYKRSMSGLTEALA